MLSPPCREAEKRNDLGDAGYGHFTQMLFVGLSLPSCQGDSRYSSGEVQNSSSCSNSKRAHAAFTSSQLLELEKEFHFSAYLCLNRRLEMAALLKLTDRHIKIRLQNHRMKCKKRKVNVKVFLLLPGN
ncbi:hypothetical protein cypCar_00033110, partial [Cyprinus carpio]